MIEGFKDFIRGLQFLSRIRLFPEEVWTPEGFGRSVKWFPLVGLFIGAGDVLVWWLASHLFHGFSLGAILVVSHIFWTGALCYDGLMDVCDGVFSGRERARMLEIMKDSRIGAFGCIALAVALICRLAFIADLPREVLPYVLLFIPVFSRWVMAGGVILYPYARKEGIGKAFSTYTGNGSFAFATIITLVIWYGGFVLCGAFAWYIWPAGIVWGALAAWWLCSQLGGLTGDCYGALSESSELIMLGMAVAVTSPFWL